MVALLALIPACLIPQTCMIFVATVIGGDVFETFSLNSLVLTTAAFANTDPATAPKKMIGGLVFGVIVGFITNYVTALLMTHGIYEYYAKVMPPLLLNPFSPHFDALSSLPLLKDAEALLATPIGHVFLLLLYSFYVMVGDLSVLLLLSPLLVGCAWVLHTYVTKDRFYWKLGTMTIIVCVFLLVRLSMCPNWTGRGSDGSAEVRDGTVILDYAYCG
eukprot:PhF_6_TR19954/c0_g1_i3/m.29079